MILEKSSFNAANFISSSTQPADLFRAPAALARKTHRLWPLSPNYRLSVFYPLSPFTRARAHPPPSPPTFSQKSLLSSDVTYQRIENCLQLLFSDRIWLIWSTKRSMSQIHDSLGIRVAPLLLPRQRCSHESRRRMEGRKHWKRRMGRRKEGGWMEQAQSISCWLLVSVKERRTVRLASVITSKENPALSIKDGQAPCFITWLS